MKTLLKIFAALALLAAFQPRASAQCGASQHCGVGWTVSPTSVQIQAPIFGHAFFVLTFSGIGNPFFEGWFSSGAFAGDFQLNFGGSAGQISCTFSQASPSPCFMTVAFSPSTSGPESTTITLFANGARLDIPVNGSTVFPPTITSFTPTSGPVSTSVTLTGTGFSGATLVSFNGSGTTVFTIISDTQIVILVPPAATTGPISVTNIAGTGTSSDNFTITGANIAGKWVLYQTSSTPSITGNRCFGSASSSCYELFFDVAQDPANINNFISPADPFGGVRALDNSSCGFGNPTSLFVLLGGYTDPSGWFIVLSESLGGWSNAFNGGHLVSSTYGAFNFNGSPAPFSGLAPMLSGTNVTSGGCPAPGYLTGFQAVHFPQLGTGTHVSINFISQPGVLNQAEQLQMVLDENPDFSVSATGTVIGPPAPCGPLTFNLNSGETIGSLYGLNGTFTDGGGNQGQMSLGLLEVTPFVVSQTDLNNAGYSANGPGIPIQVWSYDTTATPLCAADPVIGYGVAYPKHSEANSHKQKNKSDKKVDWKKFRDRWEHARVAEDRDSASGGKQ
jgi:hypothetical protein